MNANAAFGAARRDATGQRNGLHHIEVFSQTISAGTLHLAVYVKDRRALDDHRFPAAQFDIAGGIVALIQTRQIDIAALALAVLIAGGIVAIKDRHHIVTIGRHATGQCQNIGEPGCPFIQRIASRPQDLPEHRNLPATHLQDADTDLRIDQELPFFQLVADLGDGLCLRQSGQLDITNQRKPDQAARRDARFGGQVGILENRHPDAVTRPQAVIGCGNRRQHADHQAVKEQQAFRQERHDISPGCI